RRSIATKVFLGFAAVLVMSGAVSLFGIVQMHRIGQGLSLVSSGYFPLTRIAGSLEAFQKERERSTDGLLAEADPAQRASLIGLAEAERQERTARWAIIGLSLLALGVGLLVTWGSHRALAPIARLTEAAQRLGRGAPEAVAVPEGGGDELAVLAREFNAMAQRL